MKKIRLMFTMSLFALLTACSSVSQAETTAINPAAAQTETTAVNPAAAQTEMAAAGQTEITAGNPVAAQPEDESHTLVNAENQEAEKENSRILIAYFSRWGNTDYAEDVDATTSASIVTDGESRYGTTGYVAEMIQKMTGGDMHLIQSEEMYPVDFNEVVSQNHTEMGEGVLPELKDSAIDMSKYDVVFVGYPVWATDAPQVIRSFLQGVDVNGKTVIPFCTHDGYGAGRSFSTVASASIGAQVKEGIAIEANDVPGAWNVLQQWVDGLGISQKASAAKTEVSNGETAIKITIGDRVLDGVLYDNAEARQFISMLPMTVSMVGFGSREFYGGIDGRIQTESEGRYSFEDGHITYCPANNTAAIFYAQTSRPNLTMEVFPMGKVTSDLSVFDELPGMVDITFSIAEEENKEGKTLIAYFTWAENTHVENPESVDVDAMTSASLLLPGNTSRMANWIQEEVGGDLFSLVAADAYPSNYDACLERVSEEQARKARPVLAGHIENMDQYDTIFLGYPDWCSTCPMAVFTFLEEYDFSGKTVIPFCAHGTGGVGRSILDIYSEIPDAVLLKELGVYRQDMEQAQGNIKEWLKEIGIHAF